MNIFRTLAFLIAFAVPAAAATIDITQGTGTHMLTKQDGSGNNASSVTVCDATTPTTCGPVSATTGVGVNILNGSDATEGSIADAAYTSGSGTVVSILKGIYTGIQGVITAINSSAIVGFATAANQVVPFTPAAPTVSASGAVTSLVLKASATIATGGVKYYHAENATAASGYCILYNGTAAPGTGALTAGNVLGFQLLPASGFCDWSASNIPVAASTGAVLLLSSAATPFTYTTGTITGSIYGLAQ